MKNGEKKRLAKTATDGQRLPETANNEEQSKKTTNDGQRLMPR